MNKYEAIAVKIATIIGSENIVSVENCMTRLRLVLKDNVSPDKQALANISGVLSTPLTIIVAATFATIFALQPLGGLLSDCIGQAAAAAIIQVGAALAIYWRTKNKFLRRTIMSALPVGFMGVGEPLIYGVMLPLGRPFAAANDLHMEIISDVSPQTLAFLKLAQLDFVQLAMLGITTARLDYVYSPQEIAAFTHNDAAVKIQLNASTVTAAFLQDLRDAKADFSQLDTLHNFYPRPGTGLGERFFQQQNDLLHACGISTDAFLPSFNHTRLPLQAGLPTLEAHTCCALIWQPVTCAPLAAI